jgi:hypothetical protein
MTMLMFVMSFTFFLNYLRAVSVFGDLKQQYGAGNCHLLQINSKRAGQINNDIDEVTNMPDPWRLYVKQSAAVTQQQQQQSQTMPKRDSLITDSLSNLTELIDQELNLNSNRNFIFKKISYLFLLL